MWITAVDSEVREWKKSVFSLDDFTTIAVYLTGEIEHKNHDLCLGKPN